MSGSKGGQRELETYHATGKTWHHSHDPVHLNLLRTPRDLINVFRQEQKVDSPVNSLKLGPSTSVFLLLDAPMHDDVGSVVAATSHMRFGDFDPVSGWLEVFVFI